MKGLVCWDQPRLLRLQQFCRGFWSRLEDY
jgi:hypothetical protein